MVVALTTPPVSMREGWRAELIKEDKEEAPLKNNRVSTEEEGLLEDCGGCVQTEATAGADVATA
eukprot:CAMPEP_0197454390 /NCGR_PEP_ID=MMETSP1175-20131217/37835_1 /TAXON_ID=1003142 /ORGANISM="Triceratium dubium, Strain CCMP147" /LENGTH=63 /DNA_ID=CAMNT_0042987967 /DNA_START=90 /DNA_END=282 /DNA_ORIENTATION=-